MGKRPARAGSISQQSGGKALSKVKARGSPSPHVPAMAFVYAVSGWFNGKVVLRVCEAYIQERIIQIQLASLMQKLGESVQQLNELVHGHRFLDTAATGQAKRNLDGQPDQDAPVLSHPKDAMQDSRCVALRSAAIIITRQPRKTGSTRSRCPLLVANAHIDARIDRQGISSLADSGSTTVDEIGSRMRL